MSLLESSECYFQLLPTEIIVNVIKYIKLSDSWIDMYRFMLVYQNSLSMFATLDTGCDMICGLLNSRIICREYIDFLESFINNIYFENTFSYYETLEKIKHTYFLIEYKNYEGYGIGSSERVVLLGLLNDGKFIMFSSINKNITIKTSNNIKKLWKKMNHEDKRVAIIYSPFNTKDKRTSVFGVWDIKFR